MKRILITGGPTNEPIDEVMKITNMSTGSLSLNLARRALQNGDFVCLIATESVTRSNLFERYKMAEADDLLVIPIETTADMYAALESQAETRTLKPYDTVIHASAVGDYKPQFSFRMEDLAAELTRVLQQAGPGSLGLADMETLILSVLTSPRCKVNDSTKISSYEPNLTVKLTLTTKLISNLRGWFPSATLIGCKLLENVTKEHLIDVARKLCIKNNMDYILANDLAELRKGYSTRHLVTSIGYTGISLSAPGCPDLLDYASDNWL